MAYGIINYPGAQPIAETSTVQKHPLGTVARAVDPTKGEIECVYLKGVASTVVGDAVRIGADFATIRLSSAETGVGVPVGIAMSANVANQFGWYAIRGRVPANAGTVVAGAAVQAAAAGVLDDTATAGDYVGGAVFATADSGGKADVYLLYPSFGLA